LGRKKIVEVQTMTYIEAGLKKTDLERIIKSSLKIRDDFQFKIGRNRLSILRLDIAHTSMLYMSANLFKRKNTEAIQKQSITIKGKDAFAILKLLKLAKKNIISVKVNTKDEHVTLSGDNIAMTLPCKIEEIKHEPDPYKIKTDNYLKFNKDFLPILKNLSAIGDIIFLGFDRNLFLFTIADMIRYNALSYTKLRAKNAASPFLCLIDSNLLRNVFSILRNDTLTIASRNVEYPLTFRQKTDTMTIRYTLAPRIFRDTQKASEFLEKTTKIGKIPPKWYKLIPQLIKD